MEAASFFVSSFDGARKIERTARRVVCDCKNGEAPYCEISNKKIPTQLNESGFIFKKRGAD
jgi:undecaprenyl pyrophosphate synthase